MSLLLKQNELAAAGESMHRLIGELYPICRSITGAGMRQTLGRLREIVPLEIHEVPTGTQVLDWTVPKEWNIHDAWIKNAAGDKVVDFRNSNLHVVNYSAPVHCRMSLEELRGRLHTLPDRPDWIPYRTSYYQETWGFCLAHRELAQLPDGEYEVFIDSTLEDGSLTYGEYALPGRRSEEVLISCHACHPSLCNDNLSGIALTSLLARLLAAEQREYSYRFLFIPGTIGSITWLARNEAKAHKIRHGLVAACVGDSGELHYKRSRQENAEIDRAVACALSHCGETHHIRDFSPYGYDERQYCSPGFDLAVGSLTRTPHGKFPEYHTSADNLDLVRPQALASTLSIYLAVIRILEANAFYRNLKPKCEPQLGKRGLYRALGGFAEAGQAEMAMLWILNLADGRHSLLDIAERAKLSFDVIWQVSQRLVDASLLARIEQTS